MIKLIKRILCRHQVLVWHRNIHGDEIVTAAWQRSEWRCTCCGGLFTRAYLGAPGQEIAK